MARTRRKPAGPNEPRSWLEDPTKFGTEQAIWRPMDEPVQPSPETAVSYRIWVSERRAAEVQHLLAVTITASVRRSGSSLRQALETRHVPYNYTSLTRVLSGERAARLAVLFALADAFNLALTITGGQQATWTDAQGPH